MKKILLLVVFLTALSGCSLPFLSNKKAALQVNAEPQSSVFLNGNHVGQTPYFDENLKPGEYTVKIQSDSQDSQEWEANVTLNPQVVTVVSRTFGETVEKSSDYIIQMETLADDNDTEVSIITIPDNVIVKLDGQPEGFSPMAIADLSEGDHTISLTAPGYEEEVITITLRGGYKMIISARLARSQILDEPVTEIEDTATNSAELEENETEDDSDPVESEEEEKAEPTKKPSPSPRPTSGAAAGDELETPYVVIQDTGTGWLRVRSEPNGTVDNEVARVDVGDSFPFVESSNTGWYLIEYEAGEEGWISAQYADLIQ